MATRFVRVTRLLAPAAALGVALLVRAQSPAPAPAPAAGSEGIGQSFRPPAGALVAPGRAADLLLLYTGDVVGFVDPCG